MKSDINKSLVVIGCVVIAIWFIVGLTGINDDLRPHVPCTDNQCLYEDTYRDN